MIHVCMLVTNSAVDDPRVCMEAQTLASCGRYRLTVIGWDRQQSQDVHQRRDHIDFLRLGGRSTHGRGITQVYFLWRFWRRALKCLAGLRPQVVHCHDLDTLWAGARAAKAAQAKLVFDAHENFPDMMVGHLPQAAVGLLNILERRLVRRADLLVTVGNRLCRHYQHLGARQTVIVGNWKDPEAYQFAPAQLQALRKELGLDQRIVISFIANLGRERHLQPLLEAVAASDRFACVVGGSGCLEGLARQYARSHRNIVYLGAVPPARVGLLTAACDAVYYGFDTGNPNSRWSAPNKLYEAFAAGKPILAGDFGEVGLTVRQGLCGVLTDTSTAAGVARGLEQLAQPGAMEQMAQAAQRLRGTYCGRAARAALLDAYAGLTFAIRPVPLGGVA